MLTGNLKLPKLRLKEYDIIPRLWVAFWGQFCMIQEEDSIREDGKFQYLLSSLKPKTKADVGKDAPPIRVLLGADVLGSILTGKIEVFTSGVSAVETLFGWAILGLGNPIERRNKTLLEEETMTHFRETLKIREDGRYEVALHWLSGYPPVYDKHNVAESRLRSVTKRLLKENIYEIYDDVLRQWQREGIIETIPDDEILKPDHYIPHKPIKHREFHNAGVQTTLSHLREPFCILPGRIFVREVVQKCVTCKRSTSKPVLPVDSTPLPVDRINRVAAFEVTGAALSGHINLKGADILLTPPDTNKYDALKTRLIAEFSASENEQIRRLLSELHLGADKPSQLLRKMRELGGCTGIKDDFLKTLWLQRLPSEIQAILSISSEPLDNLANMADKIAEVRISSSDSSAFAVSRGAETRQQALDGLNWPLGRVIELFEGKDSVERVVKLRVPSGEIIRPIQRIFPLEINSLDMPKNVPKNVEDASDIIDDADYVSTASNEPTCQSEAFPK
ncbi:hypothetical protein HNY73_006316 [Argiope bruennichi]|uniref:Uncharacterized protein n=1 Tax=Argiope bruennichi TaxID=94029 RepID=A0A8T0FJN1_ARGBR|nr:hypothetical protein HNY73_006316 [Argiope bruennichi]